MSKVKGKKIAHLHVPFPSHIPSPTTTRNLPKSHRLLDRVPQYTDQNTQRGQKKDAKAAHLKKNSKAGPEPKKIIPLLPTRARALSKKGNNTKKEAEQKDNVQVIISVEGSNNQHKDNSSDSTSSFFPAPTRASRGRKGKDESAVPTSQKQKQKAEEKRQLRDLVGTMRDAHAFMEKRVGEMREQLGVVARVVERWEGVLEE